MLHIQIYVYIRRRYKGRAIPIQCYFFIPMPATFGIWVTKTFILRVCLVVEKNGRTEKGGWISRRILKFMFVW